MRWLDGIPVAVVRAHVHMLPKLDAEEAIQTAHRIAVGTGSLRKGVGESVMREWSRIARADEPAERPTSAGAMQRTVGGMGIGFRRVTKTT